MEKLSMINNINLFKLWYFLATGFGLGTISTIIPSGTMASLLAIPIWWFMIYYFSYQIYCIFVVFGIIFGIYFCGQTNKMIGVHDHKSIVWDEFVGMWVTLIVVPIYNWLWIVVAFCVFRALDIIQPWPISWCDCFIKDGFGIVFDDILAGVVSIFIILLLMNYLN